ncbi:MAG TPA: kelch repeat-containing protein [Thermoplasmata archaeon]|nr:kelch repeat-containing protein [Thermoplasmata archaeon]
MRWATSIAAVTVVAILIAPLPALSLRVRFAGSPQPAIPRIAAPTAPAGHHPVVTDAVGAWSRPEAPAEWGSRCREVFVPGGAPCSPLGPSVGPSVVPGNWKEVGTGLALAGGGSAYDAKDGYGIVFGGISGDSTWAYQGGRWVNLTPTRGPSPPPLSQPSMAYDTYDGYVVLFGGASASGYTNQTWTFAGGTWTNRTSTAGAAPAPRAGAGMAYDAGDSELVLYGGTGMPSSSATARAYTDTWSFAGGKWTNLTGGLVTAPSARTAFSMCADSTLDAVVLYGGQAVYGAQTYGSFLNDTWTFAAGAWINLTSVAGTPPTSRVDASLANDPSDSGVMLFGGEVPGASVSGVGADTWLYTSGRWSNVSSSAGAGPSGRLYPALFTISTATTNVTLLYSGVDPGLALIDDDGWSFASGKWSVANAPTSPSARIGPSFVYDPTDGYNVLFGGSNQADTWEFTGTAWTRLTPGLAPPGRFGAGAAYDSLDSYLVLFGGTTGFIAGGRFFADTWTYSGGLWTNVTSSQNASPSPRAYASMSYDTALKAIILFGGENSTRAFNDTWEFTGGHWTNITGFVGPPPSARGGAGLTWDSGDSYLLLFGGSGCGSPLTSAALCNDTWRLSTGTWSELSKSSPPTSRTGVAMADDPPIGAVVMYGGYGVLSCTTFSGSSSCIFGDLNQTWLFDAGTWTNATASSPSNPGPIELAGSAYDAVRGAILLFGGGTTRVGPSPEQLSWWQYTKAPPRPLLVGTPSASPNPATEGTSTQFSVSVSGGVPPYTYAWSGFPTGCISTDANPLTCTPQESGNFSVSVTVHDTNGTKVVSPAFGLEVSAPAAGSLAHVLIRPATSTIAPGDQVGLSAEGVDSGGHPVAATYTWSLATRTGASLSATSGANVTLLAGPLPGSVTVNVSAVSGTLRAQAQATVSLVGTEIAVTSFNATPATITLGSSTTLYVDIAGGEPPYRVSYAGLPGGCTSSNSSSIVCKPLGSGTYRVVVTVVDAHGGMGRAATHLIVNLPPAAPAKFPKDLTYLLIGVIVLLALIAGYLLLTHPFRRKPKARSPSSAAGPTAGATLQAWDPGTESGGSAPGNTGSAQPPGTSGG